MTGNGLVLLALLAVSVSAEAPDPTQVSALAEAVVNFARKWVNESGIKNIQEAYESAAGEATFYDVDGKTLAKEISASLTSKVFLPKIEAIKYAVEETEKIAASYIMQHNLKVSDVPSFNESFYAADVTYSKRHKRHVNFNQSRVHIPVDIYNRSSVILNELQWTANITQVFVSNQEKHPDLLWQYFGSHQGLMRYYPGADMDTDAHDEKVDLYDARRRPWYIQGSSSPKDMLILIDSSGSTLGQTLYLMKLTVRLLLETLGEDDFVLVANFSERANLVTDCFESFVQASSLNKQILNDAIDEIDPQKQANFTAALEFAFKHFEKLEEARNSRGPNRTYAGSGCNKLIVMLTDGGTERPEQLIRHHDPDGTKYRIFTYAVGQSPAPLDAVRWLGCENNGWFSTVENIGAIKPSIQKYVALLADVTAQHGQSSSHLLHVSDMYQSQLPLQSATSAPVMSLPGQPEPGWQRADVRGLGSEMLTTLTMPVYNKTQNSESTFLGVMGVDVPMQQIMNQLPRMQIGPTGYAFAVNHNGFVLFHPWLKAHDASLPDPPSIDIVDMEYLGDKLPSNEDRKDEMRKNMVDGGEDSSYTYEDTLILYGELKYVRRENRSYFTSKIANTSFSLGISLPLHTAKYIELSQLKNFTQAVEQLQQLSAQNHSSVYLARDSYCQNHASDLALTKDSGSLADVIDCLQAAGQLTNSSVLRHLVWDVTAINSVSSWWMPVLNSSVDDNETNTQFIYNSLSGLTVVRPSTNEPNETKEETLSDQHILSATERAYHRPAELVFAAPPVIADSAGSSCEQAYLVLLKAVTLNETYNPAVSGLKLPYRYLQPVLGHNDLCNSVHVCYLLDEGAYVVASSNNDTTAEVGKLIGEVDTSLLSLLLNSSVYEMYERLDYQGVEWKRSKTSTASGRLRIGSVSQFVQALVSQWWNMASLYVTQFYSLFYSLLFRGQFDYVGASGSAGIKNITVVNKKALYMFGAAAMDEGDKRLDQEGCRRFAVVRRIRGTNLLLVVADVVQDEDMHAACSNLPMHSLFGGEQLQKDYICKRSARYRNSHAQPCHRHYKRTTKPLRCRAPGLGLLWLLPATLCGLTRIMLQALL